ncbi:NUDIX domain-containing protein [Phenylobacterium sp.]|uniref:NUDIX domain-containing protein n=1 Tax=Phenylobacterium sp. TaxID=1871053 RepID=UPI002DEA9A5E|nr:NUDIX domain-containing protein [Phenylobacterium sp.]
MARETSAGVLAYRRAGDDFEFLLVHPGGPFWARKDVAAWSIPKGLVEPGEESWAAAAREFAEELGQPIGQGLFGDPQPLTPCKAPGGKLILAWLVEADLDLSDLRSNLFEMEWPRGSGRLRSFPEVDRAAYLSIADARWKIHRGQRPVLEEAVARLEAGGLRGRP